jgi:NitT/TauT family transport system ATP-binding protein
MDAKIRVDRVSHAFDQWPVLEEVKFVVKCHELLCIVGPSGCGKTTLLRILGGLVEPLSGTVYLDEEEVVAPSPKTAMVFQHFGLFPWKSVRSNIAYGLSNRGVHDRERVERMIEMIGLADAVDKYPHQLSGGMQQRVGLARALAVDPQVLLMDEPFGALDAMTREQLQDELLRIWDQDSGKTAVFITHDIDEAILLGDRVLVLAPNPGRVLTLLDIPLGRPRTAQGVRSDPAYPKLREEIWRALRPDRVELPA